MARDTQNHGWTTPEDGKDNGTWGAILEDLHDKIDAQVELRGALADRPAATDVAAGTKYIVTEGDEQGAVFVASNDSWVKQPVDATTVDAEGLDVSGWEWIDGTNHGVDNTGSEDAAADISSLVADNRLLVLPGGTYLTDSEIRIEATTKFGIVGRGDVTIQPTTNHTSSQVVNFTDDSNGNPCRTVVVSNIDFDISTQASRPLSVNAAGYNVVEDVEVTGTYDEAGSGHGGGQFDAVEEDATVIVRGFRAPDGSADLSAESQPPTGIYTGTDSLGTVRYEDCVVKGWVDNGLYTSKAAGSVEVIGGTYANNRVSNIRLGGDGSEVRGGTKVYNDSNGFGGRALWAREGTGHTFQGVKIVYSDSAYSSNIISIHPDAGSATFRDCDIDVGGSGGRIIYSRPIASDNSETEHRVLFDGCSLVGDYVGSDARPIYLDRTTTLRGCEMDVTLTTDQSRLVFVTDEHCVEDCEITADKTLFDGVSDSSRCRFAANRLTSTDGSSEIDLSGTDNVAIGNIVDNGILGVSATSANVNLST